MLLSVALDKTLTVSPNFEVLMGWNRGFHSSGRWNCVVDWV